MPFLRVKPDDTVLVAASVELGNACQEVDDPAGLPEIPELAARWLEFGWDLEPDERYLYAPVEGADPVGVLSVMLPDRDNRHLVWCGVNVHPDHRRQGHGTAMVTEVLRRAQEAGRSTVWIGGPEDDQGARAFAEHHGFVYASHDARRRQHLADVDTAEVDRLYDLAAAAASDYRLERLTSPVPEDVLAELVEVTEAINDAPMGDLTFEDEKFDVPRLRDVETARVGRGDELYRVIARHRQTGVVGGHTLVITNPLRPQFGSQGDTAVHRDHRGHKLGLLLKIEMMRWLAEVEPQLESIETWNHADNRFMIDVNQAIGYRLERVFATYERTLAPTAEAH